MILIFCPKCLSEEPPLRIGFVSFLSGPASSDYGIPARNAAMAIVSSLNAGAAPNPHNMRGFSGRQIELVFIDEAGGTTKQVTEFNQLVLRHKVDFVIGYLSSANCLAIAPAAERLKVLTILMDCGSAQVFEENNYKYVFRTRSHATMDAIAGAKYLLKIFPEIENFSGINPNYAYGQESWRDWNAVMKVLAPKVESQSSHMTKLGTGHFNSEISSLLTKKSQLIHSSLWGGDLKAFLIQAKARGLFKSTRLLLVAGEPNLQKLSGFIPDGTIVGARGMSSGMLDNQSDLNMWLKSIFKKETGETASYPVYSVANAILGLKKAYEKARLSKLQKAVPMADVAGVQEGMKEAYSPPNTQQIIESFENLSYETPNGKVSMIQGNGHQAVHGTSYGVTRTLEGKVNIENILFFPAKEVQPPGNTKSLDWIRNRLPTRNP